MGKSSSWLYHLTRKNVVSALNMIGAYALSALALIGALAIFSSENSEVSPQVITNFVLIVSLVGGFELGLVKSCLINLNETKSRSFDIAILVAKVSSKALIPTVFIFLVWNNLTTELGVLQRFIFSYCLCLIGILSSELRVIFDNIGLYSSGIWTKQAGLAIGVFTFLGAIYFGLEPTVAFVAYCLARTFWLALQFYRYTKIAVRKELILFRDTELFGWRSIFSLSVLAVFSGNIDRILASYYLDPVTAINYFLIYEIFTKYWLVNYLINPIIFVRYAAGSDGLISILSLLKVLGTISIISVGTLTLFVSYNPNFFNSVFNISIGNPYIVAFFMAIAINSVTQSLSAVLQSRGYAEYLVKITIIVTLIMGISSIFAIMEFGVNGLLVTWLIKSLFEAALVASLFYREKYEFSS